MIRLAPKMIPLSAIKKVRAFIFFYSKYFNDTFKSKNLSDIKNKKFRIFCTNIFKSKFEIKIFFVINITYEKFGNLLNINCCWWYYS